MAPVKEGGETRASSTLRGGNKQKTRMKGGMTKLPTFRGERGTWPAMWIGEESLRNPEVRDLFLSTGGGSYLLTNESEDRKVPESGLVDILSA